MRRIAAIMLALFFLLGCAFADTAISACDLVADLAKEITAIENIRNGSTEDMPECVFWTDHRTGAKCRLVVCSDEDEADALAVALGTRTTSARAVECCVITLDSDLPGEAVKDYIDSLARLLNAEIEEEPDYILNVNTRKFHYPDCVSVEEMKESNKQPYSGNREELIHQGYKACKRCNP